VAHFSALLGIPGRPGLGFRIKDEGAI